MSFRLEYAPSARSGCKATECKEKGIKIEKGELRHATFFTMAGDRQGWSFKHWGCVTPAQIANMNKAIEGNFDYLDGYEELNEADKAKVRQALAGGHVADEDWRYDVEMNRPGMKGFRSPAVKKQRAAEKRAAKVREREQNEEEDGDASPSEPAARKKQNRTKRKVEDDAEPAPEVQPKKRKAAAKKVKAEVDDEASNPEPEPKRKTKAAAKKVKTEVGDEVPDPEPEPKRKTKAATNKVNVEQDDEVGVRSKPDQKLESTARPVKTEDGKVKREGSDEGEPNMQSKRPSRGASKNVKYEDDSERDIGEPVALKSPKSEESEVEAEGITKKASRYVKKTKNEDISDTEVVKPKKGSKAASKKVKVEEKIGPETTKMPKRPKKSSKVTPDTDKLEAGSEVEVDIPEDVVKDEEVEDDIESEESIKPKVQKGQGRKRGRPTSNAHLKRARKHMPLG